jgi:hypothetical protein
MSAPQANANANPNKRPAENAVNDTANKNVKTGQEAQKAPAPVINPDGTLSVKVPADTKVVVKSYIPFQYLTRDVLDKCMAFSKAYVGQATGVYFQFNFEMFNEMMVAKNIPFQVKPAVVDQGIRKIPLFQTDLPYWRNVFGYSPYQDKKDKKKWSTSFTLTPEFCLEEEKDIVKIVDEINEWFIDAVMANYKEWKVHSQLGLSANPKKDVDVRAEIKEKDDYITFKSNFTMPTEEEFNAFLAANPGADPIIEKYAKVDVYDGITNKCITRLLGPHNNVMAKREEGDDSEQVEEKKVIYKEADWCKPMIHWSRLSFHALACSIKTDVTILKVKPAKIPNYSPDGAITGESGKEENPF